MLKSYFNFDYYYAIYLDKCIALARSMVVKSEYIADTMNEVVRSKNVIVDPHDPKEWRYYKNICGEYHFLDKDMVVVSVDTEETIIFSKENLRDHRATAKAYQFGTVLYEELLSRYPDQEILILGILYPADKDKAIAAPDGEILSYPPNLVEENEYTFIKDLQEWIRAYKFRREAPVYGFSDEYWPIANLGIFYLNLLPAILTIRKSKCKTNEAHSYHVRRYLSSHGFLDDYLDAMTLKQMLRFYMNINWIERNIGKRETQRWLIKEVMTERHLPIAEYNFKHDSSKQPDEIYPTNFFQKRSINGLEDTTPDDHLSLHQMLLKEDEIAKDNPISRQDFEYQFQRKLENSLSNTLHTKVLESKITDYTDAEAEKFSKTLLNVWTDWSSKGIFRSSVFFVDHVNGHQIRLKSKDALILYLYAYYKSFGYDFYRIPDIKVETVPILEHIPESELTLLGQTKPTNKSELFAQVEPEFIKTLLDSKLSTPNIVSIAQFYETVKVISRTLNRNLQLALDENHYVLRGYKENMVYRLYSDHWVELAPKYTDTDGILKAKTYKSFFQENQLEFRGYTQNDWAKLYKAIFEAATGANLDTTSSTRAVHRAMLSLLKQLSSYSVQYIGEANDTDLFVIDFTPPTPGDIAGYGEGLIFFEEEPIKILDHDGYGSELWDGEIITGGKDEYRLYQQGEELYQVDQSSELKTEEEMISLYFIENDYDVFTLDELTRNDDDLIDIPGISSWNKLTDSQKTKIRDFYGHDYRWKDLQQERRNLQLSPSMSGFLYPTKKKLTLTTGTGFYYPTP